MRSSNSKKQTSLKRYNSGQSSNNNKSRVASSFFSKGPIASGERINSQNSFKLSQLNLTDHIISSQRLLPNIRNQFQTDPSPKSVKTQHSHQVPQKNVQNLPNGNVLILSQNQNTESQEINLIHQKIQDRKMKPASLLINRNTYNIYKSSSPDKSSVYRIINSPLKPLTTKTIVKRMILEEDPRSIILKEKKLTKVVDKSRMSSSSVMEEVNAANYQEELQESGTSLNEEQILEEKSYESKQMKSLPPPQSNNYNQLPSIQQPDQFQPTSYQIIKFQRSAFDTKTKQNKYSRSQIDQYHPSPNRYPSANSPKISKSKHTLPHTTAYKFYMKSYISDAKLIYSAWRANPSNPPPITQKELTQMTLQQLSHRFEIYPYFYQQSKRRLLQTPAHIPTSAQNLLSLRASFHILNGRINQAKNLLQGAYNTQVITKSNNNQKKTMIFKEQQNEQEENTYSIIYNLGLVYLLLGNAKMSVFYYYKLFSNDIYRIGNVKLAWNFMISLIHAGNVGEAQGVIKEIWEYLLAKMEREGYKEGDLQSPSQIAYFKLVYQYNRLRIQNNLIREVTQFDDTINECEMQISSLKKRRKSEDYKKIQKGAGNIEQVEGVDNNEQHDVFSMGSRATDYKSKVDHANFSSTLNQFSETGRGLSTDEVHPRTPDTQKKLSRTINFDRNSKDQEEVSVKVGRNQMLLLTDDSKEGRNYQILDSSQNPTEQLKSGNIRIDPGFVEQIGSSQRRAITLDTSPTGDFSV